MADRGGEEGKDHKPKFQINKVVGNILDNTETQSLAHSVSVDLDRGSKGLTPQFRKKFSCVEELLKQQKGVGDVAILKRDEHYIYYLITKKHNEEKPKYEDLESSLRAMKAHCVEKEVQRLAMPRIGCGLDGLEWDTVYEMLKKVFGDTDIDIKVYVLP